MKISALTIIILGIAIGAVILSFGYLHQYQPNMENAKNKKAYYEDLVKVANMAKQAEKRYNDAKAIREDSAAAWQRYVATNTPGTSLATNGIDLSVDPWKLAIDARQFRNKAQLALNAQLKKGGVKVVNGPEIPFPEENSSTLLSSYFGLGPYKYPVVIWELGAVTVTGTYKQITDNMRAWTQFKGYLAVTDGLTLTGTSPNLTGSYNLVIVGFLRGNKFFGGVNEGSAPSGGGNAGAGAGSAPAPGANKGGMRTPGAAPPMGGAGPGSAPGMAPAGGAGLAPK